MGEYLSIGSNIKGLREKLGWNQRQFAEKVGAFSADYLRKIERGDIKEPKYHHLLAIAQVCDCSVDYILTGIGVAENQNITMHTESAKEAIKHLNKCARSIKKLDSEAYPALQALEDQAAELRVSPETSRELKTIELDRMGVM